MKPIRIFLSNRSIVATGGPLLLVILSLFLSKGCGSSSAHVPPPSTPPGTFRLTGRVDDLVSKSIAEGKVFLEDIQNKKVLRLECKPDANGMELPPGKYRLLTIWEQNERESDSKSTDGAQFRCRDPEFVIQSDETVHHGMLIQLPHFRKHPKLPAVSGATATWQGTLGRNSGAGRTTIDYKLSLTALNEVQLEEHRCRWLQVVVESKSLAGPLTESA